MISGALLFFFGSSCCVPAGVYIGCDLVAPGAVGDAVDSGAPIPGGGICSGPL